MQQNIRRIQGFTLLGILLLLVVITVFLVVSIGYQSQHNDRQKIDMAVIQVQQILNAALAYYVKNGSWPDCTDATAGVLKSLSSATTTSTNALQTNGFLPIPINNPWGLAQYQYMCYRPANAVSNTGATFFVEGTAPSDSLAQQIAARLPNGYDVGSNVFAGSINIPGENIGNARSMNFAGVYYSGSCVPAPTCPAGWTPSIYVLPSGVTGVDQAPTGCAGTTAPYDPANCTAVANQMNSFQAFATGDANGHPVAPGTPNTSGSGPYDCEVETDTPPSYGCEADSSGTALSSNTTYWRVCLYVRTTNGIVYPNTGSTATNTSWGKLMGSIIAITRCQPTSENTGSMEVWQTNVGGNP